MIHPITSIIQEHKSDRSRGIYSICSANRFELQAAMKQARDVHSFLLVEPTSNQVDQFGGYTDMKPLDFAEYVIAVAKENNFSPSLLILGGDHLGPNVWKDEPEHEAMNFARDQN